MALAESLYSNPGNSIKVEYHPVVQDDGTIVLEPSGKLDLQDWYNSQAPGCDLHLIVERYLRGDTAALSSVQGFFGDVRGLPCTYAAMLQRVIDGQRIFDGLPTAVKESFGSDFNRWFATAGDPDWLDKMGYKPPEVKTDAPAETVKDSAR